MKVGANVQGMMHMMSSDEVLKHALASSAFEHFEAASYCSLAAAAEDAGEPDIARTCEEIMKQELAMADWVWRQLPPMPATGHRRCHLPLRGRSMTSWQRPTNSSAEHCRITWPLEGSGDDGRFAMAWVEHSGPSVASRRRQIS